MKKDKDSGKFGPIPEPEPEEPDEHETHPHFMCKGCQTVFCTKHPDFENMKEGDACPECHIAVVTEVGMQRMPDGMPPELAMIFGGAMTELRAQTVTARVRGLLDAATRLYPYVTAIFPDPADVGVFKAGGEVTENDVARSLRCVEIVVGMEAAIIARLKAQQQAQRQGQEE